MVPNYCVGITKMHNDICEGLYSWRVEINADNVVAFVITLLSRDYEDA